MSDSITITGIVATDPKHVVTNAGLAITSFRLASPQRRFDRAKGEWIDGDTNWYTVTAFRRLATNCIGSLAKGQRVLVAGRLRIRDWSHEGRTGTSTEIDADAIGHDLSWGTASFARTISGAAGGAGADRGADAGGAGPTGAADAASDGVAVWRAPGDLAGVHDGVLVESDDPRDDHDSDADADAAGEASAGGEEPADDEPADESAEGSASERRALAGVRF